jgi:hypothetical protein
MTDLTADMIPTLTITWALLSRRNLGPFALDPSDPWIYFKKDDLSPC